MSLVREKAPFNEELLMKKKAAVEAKLREKFEEKLASANREHAAQL